MDKKSFLIYLDYEEHFNLLSDEQIGQLMRAIMQYEKTGIVPELDGMVKMAFSFIKTQLDRDREKYSNIAERNKRIAEKRWSNNKKINGKSEVPKSTKNTSGKSGIPKSTENADTDTDTDKDNDTDTDKDNDILNKFNIFSNFDENLQCDCISKSTKQKCERKSSYCINGKNYCNQHSRSVISAMLEKQNKEKRYGEYQNVFFTEEQYAKLIEEFPNDYKKRIQTLDDYIQTHGKKYKDCLATIRCWARKDGYVKPEKKPVKEYKEFDTGQLTKEQYDLYMRGKLTKEDLIKIVEESNV